MTTSPDTPDELQRQAVQEESELAKHGVATAVPIRVSRCIPETMPGPSGSYGYRIGLSLAANDRLVIPGEVSTARAKGVVLGGVWEALSLTDDPLSTTSELALLARGFSSREAAEQHGRRVQDAIRIAGIVWRVGVDFGNTRPQGYTLPNGKGYIINFGAAKTDAGEPIPIAPDLGLHVFQDASGAQFMSGARAFETRKVDISRFAGSVLRRLEQLPPLSGRQRISCELLHALRFERGAQARFVLAIAAVEALLEQSKRTGAAQTFIDRIIEYAIEIRGEQEQWVNENGLEVDEIDRLMNGLRGLRNQSITQSGKALAEKLLPMKNYLGTSAPDLFHRAYMARSKLVHTGNPGMPLENFESLARLTELFARDLFLAHLGENPEVQPAGAE